MLTPPKSTDDSWSMLVPYVTIAMHTKHTYYVTPHLFVVAIGVLLILVSCQGGSDDSLRGSEGGNGLTDSPASEIAVGETVYQNNCAACHGVNLEGEADWKIQNDDGSFRAPPHTADGHTWHHPDAQLIEAIEKGGSRLEGLNIGGTSNMPAYADILSDEEIRAVLVFLKSRWPDEIRLQQQQRN